MASTQTGSSIGESETLGALAVIPARGGSKRVPGKNLRLLGGIPLIAHTIKAATIAGIFTDIWVSSDATEILEVAARYPGVRPVPRPPELAADETRVAELMRVIAAAPENRGKYQILALLLPTCPFRTSQHLREGFAMLSEDIDGVISVTEYDFPPSLGVTLADGGLLAPLLESGPLVTGNTRSQDQQKAYRPNGAFYYSWWDSFHDRGNFFGGKVKGYVMDGLSSLDIDEEIDLQYAQFLLDQEHVVGSSNNES